MFLTFFFIFVSFALIYIFYDSTRHFFLEQLIVLLPTFLDYRYIIKAIEKIWQHNKELHNKFERVTLILDIATFLTIAALIAETIYGKGIRYCSNSDAFSGLLTVLRWQVKLKYIFVWEVLLTSTLAKISNDISKEA